MEIKNKEFYFKIITGIILFISWFSYGVSNNKGTLLVVSIILTIAFAISLFGKNLYNKAQNKQIGESKVLNLDDIELSERIVEELKNKLCNEEKGYIAQKRNRTINNDIITAVKIKFRPETLFEGDYVTEIILIINRTHKELPMSWISVNSTPEEIRASVNDMATTPFEHDREIREIRFDQFKQPIERLERITQRKKEEKEEGGSVV